MSSRKTKVLALSLGQTLTTLVSVVSAMVFARILSKTDLATYRQTMLAYDFATPLLTLGIPSSIYYFLSGAKKRQRGIILDNIVLLTMMSCVFSLFLLLGGTNLLAKRFNNPALEETLRWLIAYPLYTFPAMGLVAVLIIKERVGLATIYNVLSNMVLTLLVLLSCWLTYGYKLPLLIRIIFPAFTLPVLIYLVFSTVKGEWDRPRFNSMFDVLKFSIPLGLASMLGSVFKQLDKVIVSSMCSPEVFAVFSNGAVEIPLIGIVTGSISTVILADMRKTCVEGNKMAALDLFRKAAAKSAIFMLPVMCFLLVYAEGFIELMFSKKYFDSVLPFRVYLLELPIRIIQYGAAYIALGMNKEALWRTIGALICNVVLSIIFVLSFGAFGAALATVVSLYIWSVPFNLIKLGQGFGCHPLHILPFAQVGKIFILSIVAAVISSSMLFLRVSNVAEFLYGGIVFCLTYSLLAFKYIPDFKDIVQPILLKAKRRINANVPNASTH